MRAVLAAHRLVYMIENVYGEKEQEEEKSYIVMVSIIVVSIIVVLICLAVVKYKYFCYKTDANGNRLPEKSKRYFVSNEEVDEVDGPHIN